MSINPYQSNPTGSELPEFTAMPDARELADAMASLARWQVFFAVLGAITTGIIGVVLVLQIIFVAFSGGMVGASLSFSAIVLGFSILIYGLPTWRLIQAVRSLRRYKSGMGTVQEAIRDQLSFWRTIGYIVIVIMVIYFAAILAAMVVGGLQMF